MSLIERRQRSPVEATTDSNGSGSAAEVKLGSYRESLQVMYNLSALNGDIVVEVSNDGSDWDPHHTEAQADLTSGSEQALTGIADTAYEYARVYYDHTADDVTEIRITGK